jgi:hypothetical protein
MPETTRPQDVPDGAVCICTKGRSPEDYDGPQRDCPIHGERANTDVSDEVLLVALSAFTGRKSDSLRAWTEVELDDHEAIKRVLRAVLPAHERQVRERVAAENGQDWTRDTPDSQLTIVRLACGHAKIVLANVGAPGPGSSTWCGPCVSSVGALRYVAPQRVAPAYERQVRDRLAAEFRDAAQAIEDSAGENPDPLAEKIWQTCERDPEVPAVREDPRTIATVAYRHLAAQLTRSES